MIDLLAKPVTLGMLIRQLEAAQILLGDEVTVTCSLEFNDPAKGTLFQHQQRGGTVFGVSVNHYASDQPGSVCLVAREREWGTR